MKLIEALELMKRPAADAPKLEVFLACGFTPLHVQTFLAAHLIAAVPGKRPHIKTGLFGDLAGNLERLDPSGIEALAVLIEWGDIDARLSVRSLGGWRPAQMAAILESADQTVIRLRTAIEGLSSRVPTVVSLPTLPLPPLFSARRSELNPIEAHLHRTMATLGESLSQQPGLRIVNAQLLNEISPPSARYDVKSDVASGFPYTLSYASAVAEAMAGLMHPPSPKKGLITDLDDTLWSGILGEDGAHGISWHLDQHSHMHGMYQQMLGALAGAGVLLAVASKNDSAAVDRAFEREDLLLSKDDIFPVEAHWSPKSESVERILKTWNVGADSVVFIDDSPMEGAEVKAAFPQMECIVFPKGDDAAIWALVKRLRDLFGKSRLTEEDTLRLGSIRAGGAVRDLEQFTPGSADDFLKAAEAHVIFDMNPAKDDPRAFELVNKTNQFNLNGRRYSEAEWRNLLNDPESFLLTVAYKDKYGFLGKIAVIAGKTQRRKVHVQAWVMSCRAFSRRIEHQSVQYLFDSFAADEIIFDYQATPRNGPLQEFLGEFLAGPPASGASLLKDQFLAKVPELFHQVEGAVNV
jgi:FkbH-like protein